MVIKAWMFKVNQVFLSIMITASIYTQVRKMDVPCRNNKEKAISALQNAVYKLTVEDGRCRFVVYESGQEIYSWSYQPTIRKEEKKAVKERPISLYVLSSCIYVLLKDDELNYDNLYHEAESFDSAAEAHQFMKERGWNKYDYHIVYEYIVDSRNQDCIYGTGLGFTKAEAKEQLNRNLEYYNIEVKKNGTIKEK